MVIDSYSKDDTYELGRRIGSRIQAGSVITLIGDLGVGKTVFAKGLAEGLDIEDDIVSPTFTIVQIYEEGRMPLYHFDVYRIEDCDEMYEIGYEDYFFGEGVCLIEWADNISELIPKECIRIEIDKVPEKGFDYRRIIVSNGEEYI